MGGAKPDNSAAIAAQKQQAAAEAKMTAEKQQQADLLKRNQMGRRSLLGGTDETGKLGAGGV